MIIACTATTYTVEELELQPLIDEKLTEEHTYALFRTGDDVLEFDAAAAREFNVLSEDAKRRRLFEMSVDAFLTLGAHTRSDEFQRISSELRSGFQARATSCAREVAPDIGYEDLFHVSPWDGGGISADDYEAHARSFGLSATELVDLRHTCSISASDVSGEQGAEMKTLRAQLSELHKAALTEWMDENAHLVVRPVDN